MPLHTISGGAVTGQDRALRVLSGVRWLTSASNWMGVPSQPSGYVKCG